MPEQQEKKINKRYVSIIIWLVLIIFAYLAARHITNEISNKRAQKTAETPLINIAPTPGNPASEAPQTTSDILLKQQLQISELQNNYNNLRFELERLKTGDNLPKIIFTFVKIQDLLNAKSDYASELQKLEVLCGRDIALSNKVAKLKFFLKNPPKNSAEIADEFSKTIPEIIAKKIELNNKQGLWGKTKSVIARFITIRRVDGNAQTIEQNVDAVIMQSKNLIAQKQYGAALKTLNSLGEDYQPILIKLNIDLQNADGLQQISDEIYEYLKVLSNSN